MNDPRHWLTKTQSCQLTAVYNLCGKRDLKTYKFKHLEIKSYIIHVV